MVTDYNQGHLAEQYQQAKAQPWREWVERYSLLKLIGDPAGKSVLDVACGEGHYTRIVRNAGAAEMSGIDVSERMIELARAQEARHPLGIRYWVEDARTGATEPAFDLVIAAWLLVYARTRTELTQMCRGVASRLRPGGRFVTIIGNPAVYTMTTPPDYRKYGFDLALPDQPEEGAPVTFTLLLPDSTLTIENYYLPIDAYESALVDAGFQEFAVHTPELSPAHDKEPGFWDDFLTHPGFILIDCVTPAAP